MKNNHIQTAIKALQRQMEKYREEHKKAVDAEREAQRSVAFFAEEMFRLKKQIESLENNEGK